ncbi:uncharacterized protein LOC143023849 [Oratosquilla oratoria]|uniref:uncharacterized protein LOC143023849 n=1 Tax=Oratosquilla oratoria TaxID=337810 RepID=UPI003F76EEBE
MGVSTTLNFLRSQGFWIPKGRSSVKASIKDCKICQKYNALAYNYPKVTSMPKQHMNLIRPFNHVGVDYTGHVFLRKDNTNALSKYFILIFTCLNIRAVHFELLPDMSTKNFILAFQRFCNRYTIPTYLYSDNARSFVKGGDILERTLESNEFLDELSKNKIKHVRIPVYSAWVGAAWERLIRTVKNCLYKAIGRSKSTYFEFLTALSNIKNAINSRPLTYRASSEEFEFITPNSFLKLNNIGSLMFKDETDIWVNDENQENLENALCKQNEMFEEFRRLWYEDYLLSLRDHAKNLYQKEWSDKIKKGDVVLIKHPNKPRPFWLMGIILEIIIGHDNKVRIVKVKQNNGEIAFHTIKNLYPMELNITLGSQNPSQPSEVDTGNDSNQTNPQAPSANNRDLKPKRKAALKQRELMRNKLDYL